MLFDTFVEYNLKKVTASQIITNQTFCTINLQWFYITITIVLHYSAVKGKSLSIHCL